MGIPRPLSNAYLAEPVQTARYLAVLPLAWAWDTPLELACPGFHNVRLFISYMPFAAWAFMVFRVEISPYSSDQAGVEDWFQEGDTIQPAPLLAPGADSANLIQRQVHRYTEVVVNVQNWEYMLELGSTVERIRVSCRENSKGGPPGLCNIIALFGMQ